MSLTGLRLWPSLAAAGTVVAGGLLAREFGGGGMAQLAGALGVATAPALLGADHILDTTGFDLLAWSVLALIVARIGRTGNTRLWMLAGVILGTGLTNKHSIGIFALTIVIGAVLNGGRPVLANRHVALGVLIAVLFTIPDLCWQAHHGWATIAMTRSLAQQNGGLANTLTFIVSQLFMAAPVLIGVWIAGLRFLWRSGRPLWRALAWSYGLLIVFFAATSGAKPYYVAATYFFLLASGAVAFEQRWAEVPGRARAGAEVDVPALFLVGYVRGVADGGDGLDVGEVAAEHRGQLRVALLYYTHDGGGRWGEVFAVSPVTLLAWHRPWHRRLAHASGITPAAGAPDDRPQPPQSASS